MPEINEGYEIIAAETYLIESDGRRDRIVLGRMETKHGARFVTWESVIWPVHYLQPRDYFWGHYFEDENKARADYHRRLLERYER